MNENKKVVIEKRIRRTGEALQRNNMDFLYAPTAADVRGIVEGLLNEGDVITHGGVTSMYECPGMEELIKSPEYRYLDRSKCAPEEVPELYRKAFSADVYITSANAITEDGLLYNVDGNSNRIAAIAFGPRSVIVIAGYNKIVRDLEQAELRVKTEAAPPNCVRLSCATPCAETGECVSLKKADRQMCDGCHGDGRICCNYLISAQQRIKGRIKVIIVGEELGF